MSSSSSSSKRAAAAAATDESRSQIFSSPQAKLQKRTGKAFL